MEIVWKDIPEVTDVASSSSSAARIHTLRKPVFIKVGQLEPGTSGHNLVVQVVSAKLVLQRDYLVHGSLRQVRIAECCVGDDTGIIVFTARNDQVDLMKEGATIILRNGKIKMYKGCMRLVVDMWGRVELAPESPAASFQITVKNDNNLSLVEYELESGPAANPY